MRSYETRFTLGVDEKLDVVEFLIDFSKPLFLTLKVFGMPFKVSALNLQKSAMILELLNLQLRICSKTRSVR
jgi:hypothetical protein